MIRKKNTKGIERKLNGISKFKIDQNGSRFNPFNLNKRRQKIVTFGDSFTFCRQVNDNQTWQAYLSSQRKINVDNFGVGNYGADQALILSKKIMKKNHYKISILGIVPETILRIHSMWKHYYEYNNLFGFKPRFIIKKKKVISY